MKARLIISVAAGLLVLTGCSEQDKKSPAPSTSTQSSASTGGTTPASATSSTSASSTSSTATPNASKEAFCRDVNTAVNIEQAPGTTLNDAQTTDMTAALQRASTEAPTNVPMEFTSVITAMLADLQAPTNSLPDSWNPNAEKLAKYAADYCG